MDFHTLGSLNVRGAHAGGVPSAPKQRQALALMVLRANRLVPNSALLRELWGDTPPKTSAATLQTYIAQIRRYLAAVSGRTLDEIMNTVLTTEPGGYRLQVAAEKLDFHRFDRGIAAGRAALGAGHLEEAGGRLRTALALWRGSALENVRHGPALEIQVRRLEQLRLTTAEQLYDIDLRLGRHYEVLGDLTELAEQNPLHENFHALLMRALSQSGRRSEALQAYLALRKRLADELGLDPSPEISALQQSILVRRKEHALLSFPGDRHEPGVRRVG